MKPCAALAPLLLPVVLLGCGTPQERCIAGVTQDLRVVNGLIAETQVNLARGYSLEPEVITVPTWEYCDQPVIVVQPDGTQVWGVGGGMCWDETAQTVDRPRAIDPTVERRKLEALQKQQVVLSKRAGPAIEQCRTMYPQ
jgi:hypothetical protein